MIIFINHLFTRVRISHRLPSLIHQILIAFQITYIIVIFSCTTTILSIRIPSITISCYRLVSIFKSQSSIIQIITSIQIFISFAGKVHTHLEFIINIYFSLFTFFRFNQDNTPISTSTIDSGRCSILQNLDRFYIRGVNICHIITHYSINNN